MVIVLAIVASIWVWLSTKEMESKYLSKLEPIIGCTFTVKGGDDGRYIRVGSTADGSELRIPFSKRFAQIKFPSFEVFEFDLRNFDDMVMRQTLQLFCPANFVVVRRGNLYTFYNNS